MTIQELKNHCIMTLEVNETLRQSKAIVTSNKVTDEHELILKLIEFYEENIEAWEKVKEEISEAYKDFQNDDTCIANGINICRRIIDKHLKEAEK